MPHARRLAIISTYPPRRCGLAAYTADLRGALHRVAPDLAVDIVAVDREGLAYGPEVVAVATQNDRASFRAAAAVLADTGVDAALIQHEFGREYGTFGDPDRHCANLSAFGEALAEHGIPYAVTLHTVVSVNRIGNRELLYGLCTAAARIFVFTEAARRLVERLDIVPAERVAVVPHGAPEALRTAPDPVALRPEIASLGAAGPVLATFGLISGAKGLETAIEAMATVVERHPDVRYVIAGQTHPEEVRLHGETYREALVASVARLGLGEHVRFIDAFLTIEEIAALLRRTTVFVTPYRSADQTSSGALTFALAAARPVVSTAYQYATELLSDGAGRVVPTGDAPALAAALDALLADATELARTSAIAARTGDALLWPAIAARMAALLPTR